MSRLIDVGGATENRRAGPCFWAGAVLSVMLLPCLSAPSTAIVEPTAKKAPQTLVVEVVREPVLQCDAPFRANGKRLGKGIHRIPTGSWLHAAPTRKGQPRPEYRVYLPREVRTVRDAAWVPLLPLAPEAAEPYRRMEEQLLRPAGRTKGEPVVVRFWNPAPFGRTWTPDLRLRWVPVAGATIRITVTAFEPERVIWTRDDISGEQGELTDVGLKEAAEQAAATGVALVRFEVETAAGKQVNMLKLAVPTQEPELAKELTWWDDAKSPVVSLLGRGACLQRNGFLGAAAEAFFRAWQQDRSGLAREAFTKCLASQGVEDAEIEKVLAASPKRAPGGTRRR